MQVDRGHTQLERDLDCFLLDRTASPTKCKTILYVVPVPVLVVVLSTLLFGNITFLEWKEDMIPRLVLACVLCWAARPLDEVAVAAERL